MAELGKDILDYTRPQTHMKVQFGASCYWIEDEPVPLPYGAALTELLNDDGTAPLAVENKLLRVYLSSGEEAGPIRERYCWFLGELLRNAVSEKKKGQRKKPLAQQIYESGMDAFVSGVSLGGSPEVDTPPVNIQYAVLETADGGYELVEKMYFDRLSDFLYVECMKGLQKGFVPKRCANCGRWFLQEPGMTFAYCDQIAPGKTDETCRDIGSKASFQAKVKNNELWKIHQRAYKKYFARIRAKTMTKAEFLVWASEAERLRDEALEQYQKTTDPKEREGIVQALREELNRQ